MSLTIKCGRDPMNSLKVYAHDGTDLTEMLGITEIDIHMDCNDVVTATLKCYVDEIEIEPGRTDIKTVHVPGDVPAELKD